jgi:hypothetical protein
VPDRRQAIILTSTATAGPRCAENGVEPNAHIVEHVDREPRRCAEVRDFEVPTSALQPRGTLRNGTRSARREVCFYVVMVIVARVPECPSARQGERAGVRLTISFAM